MLSFSANGMGAVASTLLVGRLMDRDYTRAKLRLENKVGFVKTEIDTLPMEKIRMKWMPVYVGCVQLYSLHMYTNRGTDTCKQTGCIWGP
jgi:hypothetical protein